MTKSRSRKTLKKDTRPKTSHYKKISKTHKRKLSCSSYGWSLYTLREVEAACAACCQKWEKEIANVKVAEWPTPIGRQQASKKQRNNSITACNNEIRTGGILQIAGGYFLTS